MIERQSPRERCDVGTPDGEGCLVVWERAPYWAPGLRRYLPLSVDVISAHHLQEIDQIAHQVSRSVALVEFDVSPAAILPWLAMRRSREVQQPVLLLASKAWECLDAVLREIGAQMFRCDQPSYASLAVACQRWLRTLPR
ncbi:MAG: hypothetical protein KatS3mg114_0367 [Planctomycetaceae bacterium]|nr:MAG: hypothetical protein KatS3mg114_0367 [Planctomycetaceae bacterium]